VWCSDVQEMEQYIRGLVPSLKLLKDMDLEFLPLYCNIATRKFLFFCDPQRRGRPGVRRHALSVGSGPLCALVLLSRLL